jgi:3-methyladenine DNA glycosylase AlkD
MKIEESVKKELSKYQDSTKEAFFPRFFKTGKGQYGEGDMFIGITVPNIRLVSKKFSGVVLSEIKELLSSKWHEVRCVALMVLAAQFEKGDQKQKKQIFDFYLKNTKGVNNWDLVDTSAHYIVGTYLLKYTNVKETQLVLKKLATSKNMWERRIAIVSTFAFIREGILTHTFEIGKILLNDKEDLMHKALGWMLREAGKKDEAQLLQFLKKYYKQLPRTALRYSIERFPETKRKKFLCGEF